MAESDVEEHRRQLHRRVRHALSALGVVLVVVFITVAAWPRHVADLPVAATAPATTPRAVASTSTTSDQPATTTSARPTTTTPATTPLLIAANPPTVMVATSRGCEQLRSGLPSVLERELPGATRCFALSDGSLLVDHRNPDPAADASLRLTVFRGAQAADLPILNQDPLGIGTVGGHPVVFLVATNVGPVDSHPILMYDTVTRSRRTFGVGAALDSGTSRVSTGPDVIVTSGNADMGVAPVGYFTLAGLAATQGPDLTSRLPYPSADVVDVVISPDGARLAYLDGPNYRNGNPDPNDPWALVVVDAHTGHELQRTPLTAGADEYDWLEFDGRWAVASRHRSGAAGEVAEDAVVVDTSVRQPVAQRLAGASGIVTLNTR